MMDREQNMGLKIWEKNKPTREGCLKKLCETGVGQSQVKIHPNMRKNLNQAEAAGFTIPVERPRNKENRWKMIEKKREMFLIKNMIATKKQESNKLEEYATMRQDGLQCSEKMLAEDIKNFIDFFKENSEKANEASKKCDKVAKQKADKVTELKEKKDQYARIVSEINKDIETIKDYNQYKEFITELSSASFQESETERLRSEREAAQRIEGMSEVSEITSQQHTGKTKKARKGQQQAQDTTGDEVNIEPWLQDLLDEGECEYKLEPDLNLVEKFTDLEETNLFLINQKQEYEIALEDKKHDFEQIQDTYEEKVQKLRSNLEGVHSRKKAAERDKNRLESLDDQTMPVNILEEIERQVRDIFRDATGKKIDQGNAVHQLSELESILDHRIEKIKDLEEQTLDRGSGVVDFKKIEVNIRKNTNDGNRIEREQKLEIEKKAKQDEKKLKNQKKKKGGTKTRPVMYRSEKPELQEKKNDTRELTQDELDRQRYLAFDVTKA